MKNEYWTQRRHTAEVNGKRAEFKSFYKRGTFGLHSDAVQALKEIGAYEEPSDWDEILIDGARHWYGR